MPRYIDADKLQEEFKELHGGKRSLLIDTQPTADVVPMDYHERCLSVEIQKRMNMVEVVRCKDCVYRPCLIMPHSYDFDFCSYGERADA